MIVPFTGAAEDSLSQMSYDTSGVTASALMLDDLINRVVVFFSGDVFCVSIRMLRLYDSRKGTSFPASCYVRIIK